jgi:hypothetical protein
VASLHFERKISVWKDTRSSLNVESPQAGHVFNIALDLPRDTPFIDGQSAIDHSSKKGVDFESPLDIMITKTHRNV